MIKNSKNHENTIQAPSRHLTKTMRKAGALLAVATMSTAPAMAAANKAEKTPSNTLLTQLAPKHLHNLARFTVSMSEGVVGVGSANIDADQAMSTKKPITHEKKKHLKERKLKHHKHPASTAQPTETSPAPLMNLHPENLSGALTPEVTNIMAQNAVVIPELDNCSGWLLRNQTGTAVGVLTAKHCGLLPADGNLASSQSGGQTYNFGASLVAYTGNTFGNVSSNTDNDMIPQGVIASFYVDQTNTNDLAVGIFEGQDPDSVLAIAQAELPSADQRDSIPEGTVAFERSMPQYQPNDGGTERMQNFAMSILGSSKWNIIDQVGGGVTTTENLDVEVAAVPLSPDGSECSPGASGSVLFMMSSTGQPELIGVQSAYNDWGYLYTSSNPTQAQENLTYFQEEFSANLSSYSAACAFSQQLPTNETGATFIPVTVASP